MLHIEESVLEINFKALQQNFEFLKSKTKADTKFLAVVKAFGYGSDAIEVAKFLQDELNVDYFAVAYIREGAYLRAAGITTPILVLHPQIVNLKHAIAYNLEPSLYNDRIFNAFAKEAAKQGKKDYPVHLKFNTGLNRLGFFHTDTDYIFKKLKTLSQIKAVSLFSHLAASEDKNEIDFTKNQIRLFNDVVANFEQTFNYKPILHMTNTSGILNYPEAHFDMVRTGIGLYGFGNDPKYDKHLQPVASLKSVISQIHRIEKGESVGYNRAFVANDYTTIATIPIGHADGISRQFGNGVGSVVINGKKAPIIGNVCMDMLMVNITGIRCNEGDEVIIFGEGQTAEELASKINTISYEILTAVSQRIKRVFLR
ncbi:alanine racemase [Kordia algicida OT-1]|uniref:Alanine racemase n=1 Tax=Kordia algicida OT-1 TaxID=391587 RepID=A9DR22_9FLAO|nr:alanine racemase [Kordia algicida]EDP96729.1 alanine racemase [Kordia algicida OT-1]